MIGLRPQFGILFLFLLMVSSCNDSLDQYAHQGPSIKKEDHWSEPVNNSDLDAYTDPSSKPGFFPGDVKFTDEMARYNSLLEIFYKDGAGGIDFQTTLNESRSILTRPVNEEANHSRVMTYHKSGMLIIWRNQEPRIPTAIVLDNNYFGKLNGGEKIGYFGIGSDLSQFFNDESTNGEQFTIDLYNALEMKDSKFNCLEQNKCLVSDKHPQHILINIGRHLTILLSKDRKVIYEMRLHNKLLLEEEPSFDFLTGAMEFDNGKNIIPGHSWSYIKNEVDSEGFTNVLRNSVVKDFGILSLTFTKSLHDRSYSRIFPEERLKGVLVRMGYAKPILMNGKYLNLKTMSFETKASADSLSMNSLISKETAFIDIKKIGQLLKQEIQNKFKEYLVNVEVLGKQNNHYMGEYDLNIFVTHKNKGTGFVYSLSYSKFTEKLKYISYSELSESFFNSLISDSINSKIDISGVSVLNSFGSLKIGQRIKLDEIDMIRGEANVFIPEGKSIRASYQEDVFHTGIFGDSGKTSFFHTQRITISDYRIGLNIVKLEDELPATHKIVGIFIPTFFGEFSNLCGDSNLNFKLHESASESIKKVKTYKKKNVDNLNECPVFMEKSFDGNDSLRSIYFPKHNISFEFSKNELLGVYIYSNPSEVQ